MAPRPAVRLQDLDRPTLIRYTETLERMLKVATDELGLPPFPRPPSK